MLPLLWVSCAVAIVVAAFRVGHHPRALRQGRVATAVLFLAAGAAVNAFFLVRGDDYAAFADGSYIPYVRETWSSLVVPNHHVFIPALIVFELAVGGLVLRGGGWTRVAYVAAIAFHVALLSFGWGFYLWSVPMVGAFLRLLQAERRTSPVAGSEPGALVTAR